MPEATADQKSPKTPRRLKAGGEFPRQVHFAATVEDVDAKGTVISPGTKSINSNHSQTPITNPNGAATTTANVDSKTASAEGTGCEPISTQPTSFPQVGAPPGHSAAFVAQNHWHTAADPTRSLSLPGQPQTLGGCFTSPLLPQQQQLPNAGFFASPQFPGGPVTYISTSSPLVGPHPSSTSSITYIGVQPQHTPLPPHHIIAHNNVASNMADYQNTAPPPTGLNFQPPVPDTTFGPMQHVYVPRFDGGFAPCTQQPPMGNITVTQPGYVVAQQPGFIQQQPFIAQQPIMINGQPVMTQGTPQVQAVPVATAGVPGGMVMGAGGISMVAGNPGHIPEVSGLGRTPGEESLRQIKFAHANKMFEPQDFKPADDDPSRFYYVREVDGNWTQRNRFTIDRMGDCRWYVTDEGWFYAVRLPD